MSNLSVEPVCVSKSANSSPVVRRKLFRRVPKCASSSAMKSYVNEALADCEIEVDEQHMQLKVPDLMLNVRRSSTDNDITNMKTDKDKTGDQIQEKVEKLLDDFDDICKETMDQLKKLKHALKKTRDHIRHKKRQFEEKMTVRKNSCSPTSEKPVVSNGQMDDNAYYNFCILKTTLDPLTLSLRCLFNQTNNILEPLQCLQGTPWLSITFSKKQPMTKERALPLIQKTADLLSKDSPDITEAALKLNQILHPLFCSPAFNCHQDTPQRNVYSLVLWGRSGMAWHTHGFPNTRFKCEFHGWTVFACKSTINSQVPIENAQGFLRLLDGILRDSTTNAGKEILTGPLASSVCKALENALGGSWNCAVGKTGCQHTVAISNICVAEGLIKLEQGGLEFMIWQN